MIRTRNPYFRLVDDLLNDARPWLTSGNSEARGFGPALDVEENADAYIVRANLPGVSQDDISVNIHDDVLTISAETASEASDEDSKVLIRERRFGKFSRSLRFPTNVDGDAVRSQLRKWRPQHHPAQSRAPQAAADSGERHRRRRLDQSGSSYGRGDRFGRPRRFNPSPGPSPTLWPERGEETVILF